MVKKLIKMNFIQKIKLKYDNKYNYFKIKYVNPKTKYCEDNNVKLIRILYLEKNNIEKIMLKYIGEGAEIGTC